MDDYLSAYVHTGWLDLETACDAIHTRELMAGKCTAVAADRIRRHLVAMGFVATDTQFKASAFGLTPVLDLVGFKQDTGAVMLVEVKCGEWANRQTHTAQMLPPFDMLPCCGRTKCMMQLAVQFVCLRHQMQLLRIVPEQAEKMPERMFDLQERNAHLLIYNSANGHGALEEQEDGFRITTRSLPQELVQLVEHTLQRQ